MGRIESANGSLTRRWLSLGGATLGIFGLLTLLVVAERTQALDDSWNTAMANAEVAWLVSIAEVFHVIGSVPIYPMLVIAIGVGFLIARRRGLAIGWIVIVGVSQVVTTVFKIAVDRPRPIDAIVHESTAAFPSGHAAVSGAGMAIGLAVLLGFMWPHRLSLFVWVGSIYAVLMALSRTYLRVHWLTDVLGGLAVGSAVVLLAAAYIGAGKADETGRVL